MTRMRVILVAALLLMTTTAAVALASGRSAPHRGTHASAVVPARQGSEQTSPDTDTVKAGDQTTRDRVSTQTAGDGESGNESEAQSGDQGHHDTDNVNHECTGNRVE